MKGLDWKHSYFDSISRQKRSHSLPRNVATTCQGDVWMPWPQIRLESGCDGRFLDALMNLKKMGMTLTGTNPDYLGRPFRGERAQSLDGEKKAAEMDGTQPGF
jgi:hypothetical protein